MEKKAFLPRIAALQRVVAEPITDPDEQAALDKLRTPPEAVGVRAPCPATNEEALRLCLQMPAEERLPLVMEMTALLSTDERLELLDRLLAELPPDALRHLEPRLSRR